MNAPHPQWKTLHLLPLPSGAVHSFRVKQGRVLTVRQGRVWLTQQGHNEDFWLAAGDRMVLAPHCLLVVEADADSEIGLEAAQRWSTWRLLAQSRQLLRQCWPGMRGLPSVPGHASRNGA